MLISYLPDDYRKDIDVSGIDKDKISVAINDKDNMDNIGKIYYSRGW